jgi:hypothetical protein
VLEKYKQCVLFYDVEIGSFYVVYINFVLGSFKLLNFVGPEILIKEKLYLINRDAYRSPYRPVFQHTSFYRIMFFHKTDIF